MTTLPIKFVRVTELPDNPAVGTLYFVAGDQDQGLWLGVGENNLELGFYFGGVTRAPHKMKIYFKSI